MVLLLKIIIAGSEPLIETVSSKIYAKHDARAGIALTHARPPWVMWQFLRAAMMVASALTALEMHVR